MPTAFIQGQNATEWQVEEVIADIYYQLTETGETESEDLQTMLLEIAAHPFNINQITEEQLLTLRFLGQRQIDAVLAYVDRHPLVSLEELYLILHVLLHDMQLFSFHILLLFYLFLQLPLELYHLLHLFHPL